MRKYDDIRFQGLIENASIGLWSGSADPMAAAIRRITKSKYSHAALIFEIDGRVMCFESVPIGVRLIPLSARVAMLPKSGSIDLYRVPNIDPKRVRYNALAYAGQGYDFGGIGRFAQAKLLGIEPRGNAKRLFCSELVARSLELQTNLNFVAPGDLPAFSEIYLSFTK